MQHEARQTRRSPAGAGLQGRKMQSAGLRGHCSTTAPGNAAQVLLSRLDGVKKAGRGWIARCPAHEDRRASLSVAEGDDARVLLHCFAGCTAADVVAAAGLELADLYPERKDRGHLTPAQRRTLDMETRVSRRWAALSAVLPEVAVVEVAANRIIEGGTLSDDDLGRLRLAHQRIHEARQEVAA